MLPKKGDIVTMQLGRKFQPKHQHGKTTFKITSVEYGVVSFEIIESNAGWVWDTSIGIHMFTEEGFTTWTTKENNVLKLLKKVDEISQGTT